MAPNLVLALLLNLDSDILFVAVPLKSSAVFSPVARRKGSVWIFVWITVI